MKPFGTTMVLPMPAITLKNIPDKLYSELKHAARASHRSLNSEILYCLEQHLCPAKIAPADRLERIRSLRAGTGQLSPTTISKAIRSGRP